MSKLRIMLGELNTFLNNSVEDEKAVLILCGPKETNLLERATIFNKELTGNDTLTSAINKEVYLLRTGEVNKFRSALKDNKNSTFFIYNHKHILSRKELDNIAEEANQMSNLIFYDDIGDDE